MRSESAVLSETFAAHLRSAGRMQNRGEILSDPHRTRDDLELEPDYEQNDKEIVVRKDSSPGIFGWIRPRTPESTMTDEFPPDYKETGTGESDGRNSSLSSYQRHSPDSNSWKPDYEDEVIMDAIQPSTSVGELEDKGEPGSEHTSSDASVPVSIAETLAIRPVHLESEADDRETEWESEDEEEEEEECVGTVRTWRGVESIGDGIQSSGAKIRRTKGGKEADVTKEQLKKRPRAVMPWISREFLDNRTILRRLRQTDENKEEGRLKAVHEKQKFIDYFDQMNKNLLNEERQVKDRSNQSNKTTNQKQHRKKWSRLKSKMKDIISVFVLWKYSFKRIEGKFGSATLSYFHFVRLLFLINLFSSLVILSTTFLPQVLVSPQRHFNETVNCSAPTPTPTPMAAEDMDNNRSATTTGKDDYKWSVGTPKACSCSQNYTDGKKSISNRTYMAILDVLQGTEWMELSVLFIGYYFDKPTYLSSLAFLFSILGCFLSILLLIITYMSSGVQSFVFENSRANQQKFSEKVFSSWDFSLTNKETIERKREILRLEIVDLLEKTLEQTSDEVESKWKKRKIFVCRLLAAILIVAFFAGTCALLYLLVTYFIPELKKHEIKIEDEVLREFFRFLLQFLPSIVISLMNAILPILFKQILHLMASLPADYFLFLSLLLSVFIHLASLVFLFVTLLVSIWKHNTDSENCHSDPSLPVQCWETKLGQSMYNLAIMDFIIVLVMTMVLQTLKRCWRKKQVELNLDDEILTVVYTQTICWLGAFFCPFIVPITTVKLFLFFYAKKWSLFSNCNSSSKTESARRFNFFFLIILLISFVLCYFLVSYPIQRFHPSQSCGPFRIYTESDYHMYQSFSYVLLDAPKILRDIIDFLFSWMFVCIVFLVAIFLICYFAVMIGLNKRMVDLRERQLIIDRKSKVFRMSQLQLVYLRNHSN